MIIQALNLSLAPSAVTWFVAAAAVSAIAIWWIVLVRRRKVWFPLLRRLDILPRIKPRMRLEPPPLIPFLCFVAAALAALLLSSRPAHIERADRQQRSIRSHLIVDLSPSVSRIPLPELASRAGETWEFLAAGGKTTVGTSSAATITTPASREEVEKILLDTGYARAGVRLGPVLQEQLEAATSGAGTETVERVVVLSDADRHSWSGLNLGWFRGGTRLLRVALPDPQPDLANMFIESVNRLAQDAPGAIQTGGASGAALSEVWEVEILRRTVDPDGQLTTQSGTLEVLEGEAVAGRTSWTFPAGAGRLVLNVEVKATADRLLFRIEPSKPDAIKADNEFRSWRDAGPGRVNLVTEPVGEGLMQESSWQLATVMSLLGFEMVRHDSSDGAILRLVAEGKTERSSGGGSPRQAAPGTRWILLGGVAGHADEVCSNALVRQLKPADSVWLAPRNSSSSWSDLCTCYVRLAGVEARRDFCADTKTRASWIALLPSLGARQVGGKLGDESQSFAWRGVLRGGVADDELEGKGGDLLAFTLPLMPSVASGINHARFPLVIRELINFQLPGSAEKAGRWLRIADSSSVDFSPEPSLKVDLALSNVPAAESLLLQSPASSLPGLLRAGPGLPADGPAVQPEALAGGERKDNPWPWVRTLVAVAGSAVFVELAWLAAKRLMFPGSVLLLAGLLGMAGLPRTAQAAVMEMVTAGGSSQATYTKLSREVSGRTSITLAKHPRVTTIGTNMPDQPWLWVDGTVGLSGSNGKLKPALGNWLRRGGFLVIEGASSREKLDALFDVEFPVEAKWQPVPTDHELMRSFYLLDALPSCGSLIWHQFSFDGRVAAVSIPGYLSRSLQDSPGSLCPGGGEFVAGADGGGKQKLQAAEMRYRAFVNLLLVALTTDYKKDQVHLPEILKRLR
ncbi:MAG: hypothetical protein RIQ81_1599 [Pseudomonadota bacterium]